VNQEKLSSHRRETRIETNGSNIVSGVLPHTGLSLCSGHAESLTPSPHVWYCTLFRSSFGARAEQSLSPTTTFHARENRAFVSHFPLSSSRALFHSYSSSLSFLLWQDSQHRVTNITVMVRCSVSIHRPRLTWPRYRLYECLINHTILLESTKVQLGRVVSWHRSTL
jgi:hypothetical protein